MKDIRAIIMKHHRDWRLPERRVAKFVKRQQQSVMPWEQTDDELSKSSSGSSMKRAARNAMNSAVKGTGRGLKKVLTFGRSGKKDSVDDGSTVHTGGSSTPPSEITTDRQMPQEEPPVSPLEGSDSSKDRLQLFRPSNAGSGGETFKVTGIASRSATLNAYEDDNDGKKDGFCQPCEGCNIL